MAQRSGYSQKDFGAYRPREIKMKNGALLTLILSLIVTTASAASGEQLSPLPEAGLWRHKIRVLIDNQDALTSVRQAQQELIEDLPKDQQADLIAALDASDPSVSMECMTAQQTASMVRIDNLQRIIQRDLPDCDLKVIQADRSRVAVEGRCDSDNGFHGAMTGALEIISSYEIQSNFTGQKRAESQRSAANVRAEPVSFELLVTSRWAKTDCGVVLPREQLSF